MLKKQRSATLRRPRPDQQFVSKFHDRTSNLLIPSSDYVKEPSSCAPGVSSASKLEDLDISGKAGEDNKFSEEFDGFYANGIIRDRIQRNKEKGHNASYFKRCSEGMLAPDHWKRTKESFKGKLTSLNSGCVGENGDGQAETPNVSAENMPKTMKLKVGGVTHTIHAILNFKTSSSSAMNECFSDEYQHPQELISQDDLGDDHPVPKKRKSLEEVAWKHSKIKRSSHCAKKASWSKVREKDLSDKFAEKSQYDMFSELAQKNKRTPKRCMLDTTFEDDETCYLDAVTGSQTRKCEDVRENGVKKRKFSKASKCTSTGCYAEEGSVLSQPTDESMEKMTSKKEHDDTDYAEIEEPGRDTELKESRKKLKKVSAVEPQSNAKIEPLTTRRRALRAGNGATLFEFPDGLPSTSLRSKDKLSEVERQLKKEEAALRRKKEAEKKAKEAEEKAVRKILGLDSKRENNKEKSEGGEDGKAFKEEANSRMLASNTIRWIIGPTGTVVMFPEDVVLPCIFDSNRCSYPPPRETCAGPSCTNVYKYRDSKLNLPLCSLQCYRAVH